MNVASADHRREALRTLALKKIGLNTATRDFNLFRIVSLAQRAVGADAARFSIVQDGVMCSICETPEAKECHVENTRDGLQVLDTGKPYVNRSLTAKPEAEVSGQMLLGQPLEAYCVVPVFSPDRQPIGALSLFSSKQHDAKSAESSLELLNTYVRLIEDSLLLRSMSVRDVMTNLFNRRYFEEQARIEWRRAMRMQVPLSFALLDVDYFKLFNDSAGHVAGDAALAAVADVLTQTCSRAGDVVSRFGGEEFSLMLPMTSGKAALVVAEKIRSALQETRIAHPGTKGLLTLSCGISSARTIEELESGSIDSFIHDADRALYAAKGAGRNCSRHFHDILEEN